MFEGIIGNTSIKQELINSVNLNKYSHSYLFCGTDGIGKKLIAREFAKMILCKGENKYCNKCKSCIEFDSNNNPDYMEIVPDGNSIKISQIREMQQKIVEEPIISNKKVYIIDDADLMTKEAQNCLLKTLEEPPEFVTIILIGSNEASFLSTIKSRTLIIKFNNLTKTDLQNYLKEKYDKYSIDENILDASNGSIGKLESIKDKQELYNLVKKTIDSIKFSDLIDILKLSEIIYKSQEDIFEILDYINLLLLDLAKENTKYIDCIKIVEDTKIRLKANSNYNMTIDYLIFNIWEAIH